MTSLTVSVGLSEFGDQGVVGGLLRHADEALFTAKKTGGNRVCFDDVNGRYFKATFKPSSDMRNTSALLGTRGGRGRVCRNGFHARV